MRCVAELFLTLIKAARCARRGPAPALGLCLGGPAGAAPAPGTAGTDQSCSSGLHREWRHVAVFLTVVSNSRPRGRAKAGPGDPAFSLYATGPGRCVNLKRRANVH